MLKVENIRKNYHLGERRLQVLHGVDMEVEDGELVGIVGPSGAGKSTLLHIMGLLDTPTEGRVVFGGVDSSELGDRRQAYWRNKLFGFVFQFYHLLPDFTALENVSLPGLADAGMTNWYSCKQEVFDRGREIMDLVGLGDRCDHLPSQLSGGERQRVAIGRALVNEPRVLLCDEPTGNLDTETGDKILELIESVRERTGCTVVMVTHEKRIGARTERCLHLVDGKLETN
mgnify:CR=1 FL=1